MESMKWEAPLWPDNFGRLSPNGVRDGKKYVSSPDRHGPLIERNGKLTTCDSVGHRIQGVSQKTSHGQTLAFTPGRDRPVRSAIELHYNPAGRSQNDVFPEGGGDDADA
jgi:hypothetical protein